eukprot:1159251-Pelagomonas_calceolata.AAC.1
MHTHAHTQVASSELEASAGALLVHGMIAEKALTKWLWLCDYRRWFKARRPRRPSTSRLQQGQKVNLCFTVVGAGAGARHDGQPLHEHLPRRDPGLEQEAHERGGCEPDRQRDPAHLVVPGVAVKKELPDATERFAKIDKDVKGVLSKFKAKKNCVDCCNQAALGYVPGVLQLGLYEWEKLTFKGCGSASIGNMQPAVRQNAPVGRAYAAVVASRIWVYFQVCSPSVHGHVNGTEQQQA